MNKLYIICGISFAGKSTLGKAIANRYGYAEVDVDETKFQLYGHNIQDEDLRHEDWVKVYTETDKMIKDYLKAGKSVVDASRNFKKMERLSAKQIASDLGIEVVTIFVDTPKDVAWQRLLENRKKQTRRDVADENFIAILQEIEPPNADENPLIFRQNDHIDMWIEKNIAEIL